MKILGIDYGTKRMGLAWSDTTLGIVLPYGIVSVPSTKSPVPSQKEKLFKKVIDLIKSEHLDKVVIGLPITLTGQENQKTDSVQELAFEIQKHTGIPVEMCDERFSSQQADAVGAGVSRDEKSAMIILQSYLDRKK